jgi:hypothetical protein
MLKGIHQLEIIHVMLNIYFRNKCTGMNLYMYLNSNKLLRLAKIIAFSQNKDPSWNPEK